MTDKAKAFEPVVSAFRVGSETILDDLKKLREASLHLEVVSIDESARWEGTCPKCGRNATVFCVKLSNGAWTRRCKPCSGHALPTV